MIRRVRVSVFSARPVSCSQAAKYPSRSEPMPNRRNAPASPCVIAVVSVPIHCAASPPMLRDAWYARSVMSLRSSFVLTNPATSARFASVSRSTSPTVSRVAARMSFSAPLASTPAALARRENPICALSRFAYACAQFHMRPVTQTAMNPVTAPLTEKIAPRSRCHADAILRVAPSVLPVRLVNCRLSRSRIRTMTSRVGLAISDPSRGSSARTRCPWHGRMSPFGHTSRRQTA